MDKYFKSIIELDNAPIVICNLEHEIIYMNKFAKARYGKEILGSSIFNCHKPSSNDKIVQVLAWFKKSKDNNRVYINRNEKENKDLYMVAIRDEEGNLIGYYEKHEYRSVEAGAFYDFK